LFWFWFGFGFGSSDCFDKQLKILTQLVHPRDTKRLSLPWHSAAASISSTAAPQTDQSKWALDASIALLSCLCGSFYCRSGVVAILSSRSFFFSSFIRALFESVAQGFNSLKLLILSLPSSFCVCVKGVESWPNGLCGHTVSSMMNNVVY
jgi:hypothetical protein